MIYMILAMCEVWYQKSTWFSEMQGYIVVYNMIIISVILIVSYVILLWTLQLLIEQIDNKILWHELVIASDWLLFIWCNKLDNRMQSIIIHDMILTVS